MEYAAAVGYLDRWSSSWGPYILEIVLRRRVTERCSPAATDKAREGGYGVRNLHRVVSWGAKAQAVPLYLQTGVIGCYIFGHGKPLKRYLVEYALAEEAAFSCSLMASAKKLVVWRSDLAVTL